jgi:hypothetical protein
VFTNFLAIDGIDVPPARSRRVQRVGFKVRLSNTAIRRPRSVGVIVVGWAQAVGGRIVKMTREQLFAAPKVARRGEERPSGGR